MRRVLIVVDEPAVRDALAQFLSSVGFAVKTAKTGAAALAALQTGGSDAVVCGAALTDLDVESFLAQLRVAMPHLGVVLLHDGEPPAPLGGVLALQKPVRLPRIQAALVEVMRRGLA